MLHKIVLEGPVHAEACGFFSGIWWLCNQSYLIVELLFTSKYCIHLNMKPRSSMPYLLMIVYASAQQRFWDQLWEELSFLSFDLNLP